MQDLEEIIRIKNELEEKVLSNEFVTGIEVAYTDPGNTSKGYCIRILVSDKKITLVDLHLPSQYKGVPLEVIRRRIELH
jgi:hypothetical protein